MILLIGTDIESIDRFKKKPNSELSFLKGLFFESEYMYAMKKADPSQTFAGIWCAKEAVVKMLNSIAKLTPRSVEILSNSNSNPHVKLHGVSIENITISVSISHTKKYATATSVAFYSKK